MPDRKWDPNRPKGRGQPLSTIYSYVYYIHAGPEALAGRVKSRVDDSYERQSGPRRVILEE